MRLSSSFFSLGSYFLPACLGIISTFNLILSLYTGAGTCSKASRSLVMISLNTTIFLCVIWLKMHVSNLNSRLLYLTVSLSFGLIDPSGKERMTSAMLTSLMDGYLFDRIYMFGYWADYFGFWVAPGIAFVPFWIWYSTTIATDGYDMFLSVYF